MGILCNMWVHLQRRGTEQSTLPVGFYWWLNYNSIHIDLYHCSDADRDRDGLHNRRHSDRVELGRPVSGDLMPMGRRVGGDLAAMGRRRSLEDLKNGSRSDDYRRASDNFHAKPGVEISRPKVAYAADNKSWVLPLKADSRGPFSAEPRGGDLRRSGSDRRPSPPPRDYRTQRIPTQPPFTAPLRKPEHAGSWK